MKLKTIPFTQAELLTSFQQTNREVADFFAAIPAERFFTHPDGVWSPAENLVHLQAVSPVARAMKLPKFVLALLLVEANNPRVPLSRYEPPTWKSWHKVLVHPVVLFHRSMETPVSRRKYSKA